MWNDSVVIDAVAHGMDYSPANRADGCPPHVYEGFVEQDWAGTFQILESNAPGFQKTLDEVRTAWSAEETAQLYFEESDVDLLVYHEVVISGIFKNGLSPWERGAELKRANPDRVLLYAYVDPLLGPSELEHMEERHATGLVDGFKFYPTNGVFDEATGLVETTFYDDRELVFPFFEKARELGVQQIAVHKAMPVGPGRLDKDRVEDVSVAAAAFPDLTFEVVHSGWAFLEECIMQLQVSPNVYANLECTANIGVRQPRRLAEILGQFLRAGVGDRLLFGTGATATHPQPVVEALANLEMPQDLIDGYDYPELTPEIKKNIFGLNYARLHGIDPQARLAKLAKDDWHSRREAARENSVGPWHAHRENLAATAATV